MIDKKKTLSLEDLEEVSGGDGPVVINDFAPDSTLAPAINFDEGTPPWKCPSCHTTNANSLTHCRICGTKRNQSNWFERKKKRTCLVYTKFKNLIGNRHRFLFSKIMMRTFYYRILVYVLLNV